MVIKTILFPTENEDIRVVYKKDVKKKTLKKQKTWALTSLHIKDNFLNFPI